MHGEAQGHLFLYFAQKSAENGENRIYFAIHRTTSVRQATNLWWFVGAMQRVVAKHLGALEGLVHVVDERQADWDALDEVVGHLLGDKGYLGRFFASLLHEQGVVLWTPVRKGMAPIEARPWTYEMSRARRGIETVIGQLEERFHLGEVKARDRWHLTARVNRKLLSPTIARYLMRQVGIESMALDELFAA